MRRRVAIVTGVEPGLGMGVARSASDSLAVALSLFDLDGDAAYACSYLCSQQTGKITGRTTGVNGGMHI